ncbi:MAG: type II toxin-antitoxin system RelE/ParE family toxin [Ignavibacterium sp.]
MKRGYKIFWTYEAERNLKDIINYLSKNFSEKEIKKFVEKVDRRLNIISLYPKIFRKSTLKNVHRSVLTKHITIYYRFENRTIEIISLFDVRQNSNKLEIK